MTGDGTGRVTAEPDQHSVIFIGDDAAVVDALTTELPSASVRRVEEPDHALNGPLDGADCLICADQLDDVAGVNVVRAIRERRPDVPVVLYGTPDSSAEITAAFDAGATDYLQRAGEHSPPALARKVAALVTDGAGSTLSRSAASSRERELEESRRRYRTLIENFPNGAVALVDPQLRYVTFGGTPEGQTELTRTDLEGEPLREALPEEIAEVVVPRYEAALGGERSSVEATIDGESYQFHFVPVRDDDGEVFAAMGLSQNVTDRKIRESALEAHVQQQRALADLRRLALAETALDDLFAEATELVADVLDHEYAKVLEFDEGGDELLLRAGVGWRDGAVGSATVDARDNSQAGHTVLMGEPVVVEDLDTEARFAGPELLTDHDVSSGISVVVGPRDNPWGVFGTHTTDRRTYDDHEVEFVRHVTDLLATAIERERREEQIGALSDVTRLLMELESIEAVCDVVAESAPGDLGLPIAVVARYDEQAGKLRPAAATPLGEQLLERTDLFDVESGPAWEAFVNDEQRSDAPDRRIELPAEPVVLRERLALPLGRHGVLLVGVAGEGTMPDPQLGFVQTVAATIRAALDRAEREETLRDREAALQRKNEDLERLARVNEVVRGIEQVLVGASSRSEIETAVCDQLATVSPYELAWIGRHDGDGGLSRVAATGEVSYLADIDLSARDTEDREPSLAAAESGDVQVIDGVHAEPPLSRWRQSALRNGISSAVSVPIEYGRYRYGVLTVYGDRADLFDGRERETLADLCDTIAYAINAVESKRALVGDEVVELELELYDPDSFVFQFLADSGGQFDFENVFLQEGGGLRTLFSVSDATPDAVREYAARSPFVEDLRQITDDEPPLYECTLTEGGLIPRLLDHGARPQEITATGERARLVVELPATVDVRGFVEMLRAMFDVVELRARRERTLQTRSRREFQAELDAELTDRQREVLRTAYFGGFFETPRRRTGEEIGASLDISQPTFNTHLRAAQRKLFELLYGSADRETE
ncbi:PAS domain S-box-containing protein [Natronoarchaeum philippinense]|uniref:PAS domain S-box-containing protein n=1 Tax=Natronoarchaeum philippinense TaxID=558529 RepID=A0A285NTD5_NATPI|nr:bacterio-opsin activator domain-containing protein [Natronoarchaeum philippinense]SNZ12764.1 PAS domain S-box-containing protein [Natronoarchaeum philippinense]